MKTQISSHPESVQTIYGNYVAKQYMVNRKYQRKLVWTQEEKESFIDSIIKQFSVPLFLFAQYSNENNDITYEIIDGMQRLNAITAFIENEFPVLYGGKKCFFDLETLASTLNAKKEGRLTQQNPTLPEEVCQTMMTYNVPCSFITADEENIEEIFRRINSYGRRLSNQEIRQAGAIGLFPTIVRTIASYIRGDVSPNDILTLNQMHTISLSNTKLNYGINLNDVWWVRHHIITTQNMRTSRDEELIAWVLAYILLGKGTHPSSKALNKLYKYNLDDIDDSNSAFKIEQEILKIGTESVINIFAKTFSSLMSLLKAANQDFCSLIFNDQAVEGTVRSFQIVFLALYELMYKDKKTISDEKGLIQELSKIHSTILQNISSSEWNADERYHRIQLLRGLMNNYAIENKDNDVASEDWTLLVDSILRKSMIEGTQYDFKAGFHTMASGVLNTNLIRRCIKTLIASANRGPHTRSYIIVGICETEDTLHEFQVHYASRRGRRYEDTNFYITGINDEVEKYYANNFDTFQNVIIGIIKQEPIDASTKSYILTHLKFPKYYDATLMILELESTNFPITYDDKYYERHGNNTMEVSGVSAIKALEARFQQA